MSESSPSTSLEIELSHENYQRLQQLSRESDVSPEELVLRCVNERLPLLESIQCWFPGEDEERPGLLDFLEGKIPGPPVAQLIGFVPQSIEPGKVLLKFEPSRAHANPMGTLHGGVLCDVGDAAMGIAFASTLDSGESFTTIELKSNFLKPIWTETLWVRGEVLKKGKTIGLVQCRVTDDTDALVAMLLSTCLVLPAHRTREP